MASLIKKPSRSTMEDGTTVLPEVTVTPTYLHMYTAYPGSKAFPFTGHSALQISKSPNVNIKDFGNDMGRINKSMLDADYNFFTNNCSDATRESLEALTGKKMNPILFTTPGDSRDFFLQNFDSVPSNNNFGEDNYRTTISEKDAEIVRRQMFKLGQINWNNK